MGAQLVGLCLLLLVHLTLEYALFVAAQLALALLDDQFMQHRFYPRS